MNAYDTKDYLYKEFNLEHEFEHIAKHSFNKDGSSEIQFFAIVRGGLLKVSEIKYPANMYMYMRSSIDKMCSRLNEYL